METSPLTSTPSQPAATAQQQQPQQRTAASGSAADLQEMVLDAMEQARARRDSLQVHTPARYGDAPIEAHARLARARTPSEVSAASAFARRKIVQLQSALSRDSGNSDKIRAAIRQLRKAVARASRKKRDLQQERLTELQRAKAQEERKRRKAQQLRAQLSRTRSMRTVRESGYVQEAAIDSQTQSQLGSARAELREQAQSLRAAYQEQSGQYGPDGTAVEDPSTGDVIDVQA